MSHVYRQDLAFVSLLDIFCVHLSRILVCTPLEIILPAPMNRKYGKLLKSREIINSIQLTLSRKLAFNLPNAVGHDTLVPAGIGVAHDPQRQFVTGFTTNNLIRAAELVLKSPLIGIGLRIAARCRTRQSTVAALVYDSAAR